MADYMEFLAETTVDNHLIKKGYAYGDWCPPGGKNMIDTPPELSASVLYYRSNRAIAAIMELMNAVDHLKISDDSSESAKIVFRDAMVNVVLLLSPFAPHIAEELWVANGPSAAFKADGRVPGGASKNLRGCGRQSPAAPLDRLWWPGSVNRHILLCF